MKRSFHSLYIIILLFSISGCQYFRGESESETDSIRIKKLTERQLLGQTLRNKGLFYEAVAQHDSCIREAIEMHDTAQLISALNHQGANYRRLGDMEEAANYHFGALQHCDDYSDKTSVRAQTNRMQALCGIGTVLTVMGNLDDAEMFLRQALEGNGKLKNYSEQAKNYLNIGKIKELKGEADSARIYYSRSLDKDRESGSLKGISICYYRLGLLEEREGKFDEAAAYYRQSYAMGLAAKDRWHWIDPCAALANLYISRHQQDSAQHYVDIVMDAAKKMQSKVHLSDAYILKSRLEEQKGQMKQALDDFRTGHMYEDSVKNEAQSVKVYDLRLKYEIKKHAEEVQEMKRHMEYGRKKMGLFAVSIVLVVVMMFIIVMLKRFTDRRLRNAARTLEEANEKLIKVDQEQGRLFMERVDKVIDENLMQSNLNSTIIAQLMCMSRSQLNRKVKNITDMDTTHYIRERRLEKVKQMLVHTNKTIGEIEVACGFETQGYLSRMFKQKMGMTPSEYRKMETREGELRT